MMSRICATLTNGRYVLGPGRMARSAGSSGSASSSRARSSPSTTRSRLTTTQASHPAATTRSRTSPSRSSSAPVGGQARSHPVRDARPVVVHLGEPERLEPARGSWAEVSSKIGAVHHDRPTGIELPARLGFDLPERQVDRAGQVVLAILAGRQHVDDLGTLLYEPAHSVPVDRTHHCYLRSPGTALVHDPTLRAGSRPAGGARGGNRS